MRFYCLTGTPGTGKKTIAPILCKILKLNPVSINSIASKSGASSKGYVDTVSLAKVLKEIREQSLIYGHLIPHVVDKEDVKHVVVLRCDPIVLKHRLASRKYSSKKIRENVEAELIGLIAYQCYEKFGKEKVSEYDTTFSDPERASRDIARIMLGKKKTGQVDWSLTYGTEEKFTLLFSS